MTADRHSSWWPTTTVGAILLLNLVVSVDLARAFYEVGEDKLYDPEHNSDGIIPELQGNNLMLGASPKKVRWNYDDHHDEDQHEVMPVRRVSRRSDGSDIDDDDDDEKDEDKSGSSQHGQYAESPAFGESPRAAQDGEDIESFFDTHLGPQDAQDEPAQTDSSNHVLATLPVAALAKRALIVEHGAELAERRPDLVDSNTDPYEGAASSPLADMIHKLIRHHRRPIVIEQVEQEDSSQSSGTSANTQPEASKAPVEQPLGSASHQLAGITIVRGSPFLDASLSSPVAAATSSAYDGTPTTPSDLEHQQHQDQEQEQQQQAARELYMSVARHPYYAAAAASNGNVNGRYRVAGWPGAPMSVAGQQPPAGGWRRPDYSASYAHQQRQNSETASRAPAAVGSALAAEEPETMSFGLSLGGASSLFGGAGPSTDEGPHQSEGGLVGTDEEPANVGQPTETVDGDASQQDEQKHQHEHLHQYQHQWQPMMTNGLGPHQYNYYHQNFAPSQSMAMANYQRQLQQHPYLAGRYGPGAKEESSANKHEGDDYHQRYRRPESSKNQELVTRQQLLAAVSRQIKSNPYYQQQQLGGGRKVSASEHVRSKVLTETAPPFGSAAAATDDLDLYKSFHAESDPYRSFAASTQIANDDDSNSNNHSNEPQTDNTQLKGSHKAPIKAEWSSNTTTSEFEQSDDAAEQQQANQVNSKGLTDQVAAAAQASALLHVSPPGQQQAESSQKLIRVKRDDADERENEEADDDGVWVDDDEDDDNRQTASDVNETTSDVPEGEEEEAEAETTDKNDATDEANQKQADQEQEDHQQPRQLEIYHPNQGMMTAAGPPPPGMIGYPHGYEIVG